MTETPEAVRIDDLLDPVLPDGVGELFAAMEADADELDWRPDTIRRAAVEATGLDDFGDDLADDGLVLIAHLGETSGLLRGSGRLSLHAALVHNAAQRLRIVDHLVRHPEVHDIAIERPIVIAGQARTGTTHLHNLIAADPALRSLPYWEACEPVPPLAERGTDQRYQRTAETLAGLNHVLPYFRRMHDMYPEHVHEEIELMKPAFGGMLWETTLCDPRYRQVYEATDQTAMYEWMRTALQVCTHLGGGGGERWVLKSPQHVEQFGPLLSVFPDATVVCTHRDPLAVTRSFATMVTYAARTSARPERLADVAHYWVDRIERMFRAYVDGRDLVPDEQSIDVDFDEFMTDDVAMVQRIYEVADQPFTSQVRAAMNAFMVEHPRGKHGLVRTNLGDLGHDPGERRRALAFYADRFDTEQ